MKFLVDENVGQSVIHYLIEHKHNVLQVKGEFPGREDIFLLKQAFQEKRIVITNDKDFGYLVYHYKMPSCGIILFRFILESPALKIEFLKEVLNLEENKIFNSFIVISEGKIRIRPLLIANL